MVRAWIRWVTFGAGVVVLTVSLIVLFERRVSVFDAGDWWIGGLIGLGLVVSALGRPWLRRSPADAPPDAEG